MIVEKSYGKFLIYEENDLVSQLIRDGDADFVFDQHNIDALAPFINKDTILLDAGAYIGDQVVYYANKVKQIYAFEPQANRFEQLVENIKLNNFNNVTAYNLGLSDKETSLSIDGGMANGNGAAMIFGNVDTDTEFKAITLDSLDLSKVDAIKVDCQGMDYLVIKGGIETIKKFKPVIVFEQESFSQFSLQDTLDLLLPIGYKVDRIGNNNDYICTIK